MNHSPRAHRAEPDVILYRWFRFRLGGECGTAGDSLRPSGDVGGDAASISGMRDAREFRKLKREVGGRAARGQLAGFWVRVRVRAGATEACGTAGGCRCSLVSGSVDTAQAGPAARRCGRPDPAGSAAWQARTRLHLCILHPPLVFSGF